MLEPGFYIDSASGTPSEGDVAVIELAVAEGFVLSAEDAAFVAGRSWAEYSNDGAVAADQLDYIAEDAVSWLNDHAVPEGHYAGWDGYAGGFGVWSREGDES